MVCFQEGAMMAQVQYLKPLTDLVHITVLLKQSNVCSSFLLGNLELAFLR